ncbi:MAG: CDGSH iron-sulfur domain-containing protein [Planctomycetes bacterium]|nr:CDGSH iron-sulfur domain-containing protein [Planctomycetota bacterium]
MQNSPYFLECEPGRVAICTCGKSEKLPRCDGSHKGSDARPVIVELEEPKTLAICACGRSGNSPYCDGSHARG